MQCDWYVGVTKGSELVIKAVEIEHLHTWKYASFMTIVPKTRGRWTAKGEEPGEEQERSCPRDSNKTEH